MKMIKFTILFILSLSLIGCDAFDVELSPVHLKEVDKYCSSNDGLLKITNAEIDDEYESCGYRCEQKTGRKIYSVEFECKNNSAFDLEFTE